MPYKNPEDEKARNIRRRPQKRAYMRTYRADHVERENERSRKWYAANKDKVAVRQKGYAKAHPEIMQKAKDKYRSKPEYREKARVYASKWRGENRDQFNATARVCHARKYEADLNYRIRCRLRARLQKKLLNRGIRKVANTLSLTGCTPQFLKGYLEKTLQPDMTWKDVFEGRVHIDHIIPCAEFDLRDPVQQRQCFHYTNLRFLWATDNLKKGKKITNEDFTKLGVSS